MEHIDCEQSRRRMVVKSFRKISSFADRPVFVPSHCVHASSTKSGIYSSLWNFRGWRILRRARPRNLLHFLLVAKERKMRKFHGYLWHAVRKLATILQQPSSFSTAKNRMLLPQYFIAMRFGLRFHTKTSYSAQRNQSELYGE